MCMYGGIGACGIENKHLPFILSNRMYIYKNIRRCDDNYEYTLRLNTYKIVIHFQEIHPPHIINRYTRDLTLYD